MPAEKHPSRLATAKFIGFIKVDHVDTAIKNPAATNQNGKLLKLQLITKVPAMLALLLACTCKCFFFSNNSVRHGDVALSFCAINNM